MARAFESCIKFTHLDDSPVIYPGVYWREQTSGPERLVLAPALSRIDLMRALSRAVDQDAYVLYVLRVPRRGHRQGRYQSPGVLDQQSRDEFLYEFGEYLDRDGRHQLWIGTPENSALIVWDEHQWIYCYGDLDAFERVARQAHLAPGRAEIPVPHSHCYHNLFDDTEDEMIGRYDWIWSEDPDQ
jgi:hypothetical protein